MDYDFALMTQEKNRKVVKLVRGSAWAKGGKQLLQLKNQTLQVFMELFGRQTIAKNVFVFIVL